MEDLKKMTYEEKTDYLVARIDSLTEKVEAMINQVHLNNIQKMCYPLNVLPGDEDYTNQFLVGGGKNMFNTQNE